MTQIIHWSAVTLSVGGQVKVYELFCSNCGSDKIAMLTHYGEDGYSCMECEEMELFDEDG